MSYGNTFAKGRKTVGGGGRRIWHEVYHKYPVGGVISNLADYNVGDVIPAGSMAIWSKAADGGFEVQIVKSTDTDNLAAVNGLTENDVYVEEGTFAATVAVVFAGAIYSSRLEDEVPASVWTNLVEIKQIPEV